MAKRVTRQKVKETTRRGIKTRTTVTVTKTRVSRRKK